MLSIAAEAVVVVISLEFGNTVARRVDRSKAGGVVIVPTLEMLVGLGTTGGLTLDVPVPLVNG